MTNEEAKPGVVVRLKSGGPQMTIESNPFENQVMCSWFDKVQHRDMFHVATLELVPPSRPGPFLMGLG